MASRSTAPVSFALTIALTALAFTAVLVVPPAAAQDGDVCRTPIDVALVVDTSHSMRNTMGGEQKIDLAKEGAEHFASGLATSDASSLVSFSKGAIVHQPMTQDHTKTVDAIQNLGIEYPRTHIHKGIETAQGELVNDGRSYAPDVMVVLTDGKPYPRHTTDDTYDAADAAKAAGIEIYTIGIGNNLNAQLLNDIATTPDHFFHVTQADGVLDAFAEIRQNEIPDRYSGEAYAVTVKADENANSVHVEKVNQQLLPDPGAKTIETVTITTTNPALRITFDVAKSQTDALHDPKRVEAHAVHTITDLEIWDTAADKLLVGAETIKAESHSYATPTWAFSSPGASSLSHLYVLGYQHITTPPANFIIPIPGGQLVLNEQSYTQQGQMSALRTNMVHLESQHTVAGKTVRLEVVVASAFSSAACGTDPVDRPDEVEDPIDVQSDADRWTAYNLTLDPQGACGALPDEMTCPV